MKISVHVWSGSRTAAIIDMANAGKVGKVCRRLYVEGVAYAGDRIGYDKTSATHATISR